MGGGEEGEEKRQRLGRGSVRGGVEEKRKRLGRGGGAGAERRDRDKTAVVVRAERFRLFL